MRRAIEVVVWSDDFGGTSKTPAYDHAGNMIDDGTFVCVYDAPALRADRPVAGAPGSDCPLPHGRGSAGRAGRSLRLGRVVSLTLHALIDRAPLATDGYFSTRSISVFRALVEGWSSS